MAVLQISRIQHRRGLQQDLPQLASAELGWSIDQRRLFIGNGTLGEGAPIQGVTEILTQHTDLIDVIKFYIYKGEEGGYTAQTGPTPSDPTIRSLQHKFDDFVSVRDFGAVGDGVTNDIDAIYRALEQIYRLDQTVSNPRARRTIYFPAGTYKIGASAEHPYGVVLIPTWCRVVGDGIDSTIIVQSDVTQDYVMRFTDSSFVYGTDIGLTPFIAMPTDISVEHMTIKQGTNKNVMLIDNAVNVNFRMVRFSGVSDWTNYLSPAAITFNAFKVTPSNITFDACQFDNLGYAAISDVSANNVRFNNCLFTKLFSAFRLGQTSGAPSNFRITNSIFKDITYHAIDSYPSATGIVSSGNSYYNINSDGIAIMYVGNGNYSINDFFDVDEEHRVSVGSNKVIQIQANVGIVLGSATIGTGGTIYLEPTEGVVSTGITLPMSGVMNYMMTYTTFQYGTLSFSYDNWSEDFTRGDTNSQPIIKLSVQGSTLMYDNSHSSGVVFQYNINHFFQ